MSLLGMSHSEIEREMTRIESQIRRRVDERETRRREGRSTITVDRILEELDARLTEYHQQLHPIAIPGRSPDTNTCSYKGCDQIIEANGYRHPRGLCDFHRAALSG